MELSGRARALEELASRDFDLLIVGGGISGLALAILLSQRGVEPVVVERAAAWPAASYPIGLWPNGVR